MSVMLGTLLFTLPEAENEKMQLLNRWNQSGKQVKDIFLCLVSKAFQIPDIEI